MCIAKSGNLDRVTVDYGTSLQENDGTLDLKITARTLNTPPLDLSWMVARQARRSADCP